MTHKYYSQRTGSNPNLEGLPLEDTIDLFSRIFDQLRSDGYFDEAFGYWCIDADHIEGNVKDIELEMLLGIRKKNLWPISEYASSYSEDDFLDVIEFLYHYVSKPIDGTMHSYGGCGMHWETFNKEEGKKFYREKINSVLAHYKNKFELSSKGEVLHQPEQGFEQIFTADVPSKDTNVIGRINAATTNFRRHDSSIDDRRQAVRDLADVLEYLKPQVQELLTNKDEKDLFNIANNFGIRHHNDKQKTDLPPASGPV
ncbi:hypothetical protein [Solemya velum gill symbiont]|uniref:Uncharacterized protein n=1 Tax=Solemya velum gill symbiont TaxID=2340 RepID=A0A0B0H8L1_SOVGS|nr:hypothetical protein [Solemya velum gill symbiont]KHF24992.1 hypothetical protein JV46_04560 [Solemya velum gill symbiont]OOY50452.1 hypothetical protein BOV97_11255 [Solemya velum gill symbiont]OOY54648.1 hypothetical protein BOV99_10450 [Solemya velum gill symbiont]OOY55241.1 hypothetical protein BOW00_10455 [Solemya velum gill symbiont]OOY59241.1 hypothetical protein BOW02_10660 [Solemya velum gill symbiont]